MIWRLHGSNPASAINQMVKDKRLRLRCKMCKKRINLVVALKKQEKTIGKNKFVEFTKLLTCPNCLGQAEFKKLVIQDL
jgi:uncharacterized protein with PIN domain